MSTFHTCVEQVLEEAEERLQISLALYNLPQLGLPIFSLILPQERPDGSLVQSVLGYPLDAHQSLSFHHYKE